MKDDELEMMTWVLQKETAGGLSTPSEQVDTAKQKKILSIEQREYVSNCLYRQVRSDRNLAMFRVQIQILLHMLKLSLPGSLTAPPVRRPPSPPRATSRRRYRHTKDHVGRPS